MSGAQRIHDYTLLIERAKAHGVNLDEVRGYVECFKNGAPPHAGGGVGGCASSIYFRSPWMCKWMIFFLSALSRLCHSLSLLLLQVWNAL